MGQQLSYEIGKLNVGRRIKVWSQPGKQHGMAALLKEAHPSYALVLVDNSGAPHKAEWKDVRDWTSHNTQPLVLPVSPNGTAKRVAPPMPAPAPEPAPGSPFDAFADLAGKLSQALKDIDDAENEVDTATEMLQQANARHADAVQRLAALRKSVTDATRLIDSHLVGTAAAVPPNK